MGLSGVQLDPEGKPYLDPDSQHCFLPEEVDRHQSMAGKDMIQEQIHTSDISTLARLRNNR